MSTDTRDFIRLVKSMGYTVEKTNGGHLRLTKPGMPAIFAANTPSDWRSHKNKMAVIKRLERQHLGGGHTQ